MNKSKKHKKQNIKKDKSAPSSAPSVVGIQLEDANTIMPHTLLFERPCCTDQGSAVLYGLVLESHGLCSISPLTLDQHWSWPIASAQSQNSKLICG